MKDEESLCKSSLIKKGFMSNDATKYQFLEAKERGADLGAPRVGTGNQKED
jgi:hypothetical protein